MPLWFGCNSAPQSAVGAGPNDMILVEEAAGATLIVAASMDSQIQFFSISEDAPAGSTVSSRLFFEPNAQGVAANPWSLAATPDAKYLLATLYGDNAVALIDLPSRRLLSIFKHEAPNLKHPTAIKIIGDNAFVLFTNFIEWPSTPGAAAIYGPATLARLKLDSGALRYIESIDLPCKNPSDLDLDPSGRLSVVCSGSLKSNSQGDLQLDHGASLVLMHQLLTSDETPQLQVDSALTLQFSGGSIITSTAGYFLLGNTKRQILYLPQNATNEAQGQIISFNPDAPDESGFLPSFVRWNDGLAFVTDYRNDQLVAIDLIHHSLFPAPFNAPIQLREDESPIFKGPIAISRRSESLYVLMGLSSEIISLPFGPHTH